MPPSGINAFVNELFMRAGLEAKAKDGVVVILDNDGNPIGSGRNVPLAIQSISARNFMKYGQVLGLAMAYAFGPDGVVSAVFALQRDDLDDLLDEEEEDALEDDEDADEDEDEDDSDEDEDDSDEDEDEDNADDDDDADYDDSQDIKEGRIEFVENDEA